MDIHSIIPNYQNLPMPAPVWLLELLLVLGFFLHVVPMNVSLGGSFLAPVFLFFGRNNHDSNIYQLGRRLAYSLPIFISFAITQGIVPLLFIQLLYGPMFYTASVLIAVPWISILFLLLISYYITYIVIYRYLNVQTHEKASADTKAIILLFIGFLGFLTIAFLFTNNTTLMLTPQKWLAMYTAHPTGLNLNLGEPQLIARYSHFVLAAIAVAGLAVAGLGAYRVDNQDEFSKFAIKLGSRIFLSVTLLQIPVGVWFLFSIPHDIMVNFMGQDKISTLVFSLAMLLALLALLASSLASFSGSVKAYYAELTIGLSVVLAMIINRHELRSFYFQDLIKPELVPVKMQWDLIIIFSISAIGLIYYFYWLSHLVWNAFHQKQQLKIIEEVNHGKSI